MAFLLGGGEGTNLRIPLGEGRGGGGGGVSQSTTGVPKSLSQDRMIDTCMFVAFVGSLKSVS